ncbi:hypothetical protein B0A55_05871 [Friedmanniomyces simplex]|uniref:NAD(P)-binding protein n=1 Tax=Friedmanniomyces simplex TaxID=329884 RepID=A0A4V5NGQ3_9PEZI|nr:hypothetical protein B0A55_05871 [Friedmanniomyces simplex]
MGSAAPKVAIITGGASGMGFAVASALAAQGDWDLHLLDLNAERGHEAAQSMVCATFHPVNVTRYAELAAAFKAAFLRHRRIDFVFANAGIVDSGAYYAVQQTGDEPPPEPSSAVVDIDLTSVINTSYLAQHYFRQTPRSAQGPRSLVITASCGGFYACPVQPIYGAAKHGAVGWARNIAGRSWREDGVRVNAICPGTVRTNLLSDEAWKTFPEEYFTPVEKVAEVVMMFLKGSGEGWERRQAMVGQTVEISGRKHYFRKQYEFCDEAMEAVMGSTEVDEFVQ